MTPQRGVPGQRGPQGNQGNRGNPGAAGATGATGPAAAEHQFPWNKILYLLSLVGIGLAIVLSVGASSTANKAAVQAQSTADKMQLLCIESEVEC